MNDTLRIILTLLVNDALIDMQGSVSTFLNGEYNQALTQARDKLAALLEHVQEHIDYRKDMDDRADENAQFMDFSEPPPTASGSEPLAPGNDIMAAMQSFDHDL